jgi:predicted nucleotidyltransferase
MVSPIALSGGTVLFSPVDEARAPEVNMMNRLTPTPFLDVNEVLNLLLTNVKEILKDQFVGMHLYGSLSSGDFNPETSDVDFLVTTAGSLAENKIAQLKSMHEHLWSSRLKRAERLEGAYVPKELIRRHATNGSPCPTINEGRFYVARLGSDWIIQRHVIREYGVVLEGPEPKTLIEFVSTDEIREAVRGILNEWWFPMLDDPSWLRRHESNYHGYTVITMCRALHALQHGMIVSKPVAVKWARETLDTQWHGLIEQAVASQYGKHSEFFQETLEFIDFTREQLLRKETKKS